MKRCTHCQRLKPEGAFHEGRSECKPCRRIVRYALRYPDEDPCDSCGVKRPCGPNWVCRPCNAQDGLRLCKRCGELLPVGKFKGRGTTCKTCKGVVRSQG